MAQGSSGSYDFSFKILVIGDSGVGKSALLLSFISNSVENPLPTIGVDFNIEMFTVDGQRLKLTIWDTAGQERHRTLPGIYYRDVQGIILVYDITRHKTFTNLSDVWLKDIELHCTNKDCVKVFVGNKVDKESARAVTKEEGISLAQKYGCPFLECSAKTRENVEQCFEELALKILAVRGLKGPTATQDNTLELNQVISTPPIFEPSNGGGGLVKEGPTAMQDNNLDLNQMTTTPQSFNLVVVVAVAMVVVVVVVAIADKLH